MTKTLIVLLVLLTAGYLAIAGLVFLAQTRMLFPTEAVGPADALPAGSERWRLAVGGDQLHGVHIPPDPGHPARREVILGFGGNAWNAEAAALYLHGLYPNHDVVAFHFRGYAPSTGRPGAKAMLEDAPFIHDFTAERLGGRPIVAVGFSVGSAVAARLTRERALHGVILVTPFDSLRRVAGAHYPWLPVRLLLRHQFEPARDLNGLATPVAIVAAERDELIARERTDALRRSVGTLVFDRTIAGTGHNDIYGLPEFQQAMQEALGAIADSGSR